MEKPTPRKEICKRVISSYFGTLIDRMYIKKYFELNQRKEIDEMFEIIVDSFRNILIDNEWMNNQTKNEALDKV